jgi:hypothetical protein
MSMPMLRFWSPASIGRLSWRPLSFQTERVMSAIGVRREKAALSSG